MRFAVIGHVEWIEFARVERVPAPGEIVHALEAWAEPAGGGAVASVQLARLAGASALFTAVGNDRVGALVVPELAEHGVRVEAAVRPEPQRHGLTFLDSDGERTITVIGERIGPRRSDDLPWEELEETDGVYFVSGDAGAVRAARAARLVVATARSLPTLQEAGVELDALVRSGSDGGERYRKGDLGPAPRLEVATDGERGGTYSVHGGPTRTYEAATLPGPLLDTYGAGDSFAAGLTFALAQGLPDEGALALAAHCGAEALARRGAHGS
jgi:ribokinase